MREVADIEVIRRAVHHAIDTGAGARFPADVGALVGAVGQRLIAIGEHDGISSLEGDKTIYLPATDSSVHNAIHVSANSPAAAHRQLINCGESQAVWHIIRADALFRPKIRQVLRRSDKSEIADPRVAA